MKKYKKPGDMYNAQKKKYRMPTGSQFATKKEMADSKARGFQKPSMALFKQALMGKKKKKLAPSKPFVPYYGGYGGKMSSGAGWGGEKPNSIKGAMKTLKKKKETKKHESKETKKHEAKESKAFEAKEKKKKKSEFSPVQPPKKSGIAYKKTNKKSK